MSGKLVGIAIMVIAALVGAGIYYFQVYGYYEDVAAVDLTGVELISVVSGEAETILADNLQAIDANSSPIRYRACFTTPMSQALLTETYVVYPDAEPLTGPGWFDCYDANKVGAALENGTAIAFLSQFNVVYGIDRVVAVTDDGRGYVWHQINACGEKVFDGEQPPEGCPPKPATGEGTE
jgi:hypothetical protein